MIESYSNRVRVVRSWGGPSKGTIIEVTRARREQLLRMGFVIPVIEEKKKAKREA